MKPGPKSWIYQTSNAQHCTVQRHEICRNGAIHWPKQLIFESLMQKTAMYAPQTTGSGVRLCSTILIKTEKMQLSAEDPILFPFSPTFTLYLIFLSFLVFFPCSPLCFPYFFSLFDSFLLVSFLLSLSFCLFPPTYFFVYFKLYKLYG